MGLFNWFRRKKRVPKKPRNSSTPVKVTHEKLQHKKNVMNSQPVHSHNNDPKLTKKERLKIDSDGNVTVPAERTYAYTSNKIKHNGYNPHKDLEHRKFLFSKHIVYNPIEANSNQMKRIRSLFVSDKWRVSSKNYNINSIYIIPDGAKSHTSDSAISMSVNSSKNSYRASIPSDKSVASQSTSSYSDDTSNILSMAGSSGVSVDDLVNQLEKDTKHQLSMDDNASDSLSSNQQTSSNASVDATKLHTNSDQSGEIYQSSSNFNPDEFVIKPHNESSSVDNSAIVASLENSTSSSPSASRSSLNAYNWAQSKIRDQQKSNPVSKVISSSNLNVSANTNSASSESSMPSVATESDFQAAVSSAKSSATSTANRRNSVSRSQLSLTYTQKLEASYTAKSKSNDRVLAREKERVDDQIKAYKKQEHARQQAGRAKKAQKINSLQNDIKALETSVAVLGGSEARARSASASRASSASVARSVNAQLSNNNKSHSVAMLLSESAYSASASSYETQITDYDRRIKAMQQHTSKLNNALNSANSKASNANASLSVLKKKSNRIAREARKHKALAIAYNKSYRDLMKDEIKKQRELRKNKQALAKAQKKNQQLVVVSKNNTDVLRKVSRLNTNVKQARGQMLVYKGQVDKLRKAYLILKRKSRSALANEAQSRKNKKLLETERAKNRKIRAVMHRLYDNNVDGQKKNKKLQKTIIAMHRSSIHTIKQLRHNIDNQYKLKYNKKLMNITNRMVNTDNSVISDDQFGGLDDNLSDSDENSIRDNQFKPKESHNDSKAGHDHITINGFHPSHHFTEPDADKSNSSSASHIPRRSQVHNDSSHSFLSGLFHHHNYDNNPSSYYTQNEVHSNQRIFLLRNVVQHSSKGLRTLKTGDKLYTTMLMPGPSGEDYKTNFLLRDGTSIPATKRTVKLID